MNYRDEVLATLAGVVVGLILIVLLGGGALVINAFKCAARWQASGIQTDFGPLQGCLIFYNGKWIPEDRYRAVDE